MKFAPVIGTLVFVTYFQIEEFKSEECPHSLIWAREMIGIPFYPGMKLKTAEKIVDVINNYGG